MLTAGLYLVSVLIYPNASTLALASHSNKGDASATMSFLNMASTTTLVSIMMLMPGSSVKEYTLTLLLMASMGFVLLWVTGNSE